MKYSTSASDASDLRQKLNAIAVLGGTVSEVYPRGTWQDQQGEDIFFTHYGTRFVKIGATWFTVDRVDDEANVKCQPTRDGSISIDMDLP